MGADTTGIFLNRKVKKYAYNETDKIAYVPLNLKSIPGIFNRRYFRNYKWYFAQRNHLTTLYQTLHREIQKFPCDLILFRYPLANKFLLRFVKKYPEKIVFEHNTKELDELKINISQNKLSAYMYESEKKYAPEIWKLSRGIVGVTKEICQYEVKRSKNHIKNFTVISNGIDFSSGAQNIPLHYNGENLNLLFLCGSPSVWHGEDRLINGIRNYTGSIKINLHILENV